MEMIHGILARLWCSCGLVMLIGAFCLLIMWIEKDRKTEMIAAGWICILLGMGMGLWYSYALLHPQEQTVCATFLFDQKKTDVMPPLPSSREYIFETDQGKMIGLYMDSHMKQQLLSEDLEQEACYRVTYEGRTDLILKLEQE